MALGTGLVSTDLSLAASGQFAGKIRKSLKWNMVKLKGEQSLLETFKKLRACGYEGLEPGVSEIRAGQVEEWIAASRESGLILDGTVAARTGPPTLVMASRETTGTRLWASAWS